jgi:SPP1 family predicted phage head-tail adaptor
MQYGRLDRQITIQRKIETQSESGQPIETWSALLSRRAASKQPVRGEERFTAPQIAALEQVEFRIRWSANVADLSPLDRIVYPAINEGDPVLTRSIYEILAVSEIGRQDGLSIITFRRADA